ncbi:hypothetical protein B0H14DRAFT_3864951 [Mycena olivaceomarginata]|nr:hypothetical protein B0H14DRAFT_3864951 [Mycena olivaceomarginata]
MARIQFIRRHFISLCFGAQHPIRLQPLQSTCQPLSSLYHHHHHPTHTFVHTHTLHKMLSLLKKRLSSGSSSVSSGLKPLFLVEKLVSAKVITPVEASRSSAVGPKKTRPPRGPPRVAAGRRPSAQAVVAQRPPLRRFNAYGNSRSCLSGTKSHPSPRSSSAQPEVVRKASPPRSRIPKAVIVPAKASPLPPSRAPRRPSPSALVSRSLFAALLFSPPFVARPHARWVSSPSESP